MEEGKAQALHDSLSRAVDKRGKAGGLGLGSGAYSWSINNSASTTEERPDSLPKNPLYANFVREGSFDPNKSNHGDGRAVKRNFDDCRSADVGKKVGSSSSDSSSEEDRPKQKAKKMSKEEKKAAKLEAKRQAKLAEKKAAKLAEKKKAAKLATQSRKEADEPIQSNEKKPDKSEAIDEKCLRDGNFREQKKSKKKDKSKKEEKCDPDVVINEEAILSVDAATNGKKRKKIGSSDKSKSEKANENGSLIKDANGKRRQRKDDEEDNSRIGKADNGSRNGDKGMKQIDVDVDKKDLVPLKKTVDNHSALNPEKKAKDKKKMKKKDGKKTTRVKEK